MPPETNLYERQKSKPFWVWLLLIGINGMFAFGLIMQTVFDWAFGDKPVPSIVLAFLLLFTLAISLFIWSLRLETKLDSDGVSVRFWPIQSAYKLYPWDKVKEAYVRTYKPIAEFGGWGLRVGTRGSAFNMSGNIGIQLVMCDGSNLLIGTQKPTEAAEILTMFGYADSAEAFQ